MSRTWSGKQLAIFDWFEHPVRGHQALVVNALAGTGKSTTAEEAVTRTREKKVLYMAFNNRIVKEFVARGTRATVKTSHSVGLSCVRHHWPDVRWDFTDERANWLTEQVCGPSVPLEIRRLITQLHTKGREILPHARADGELLDLIYQFELYPSDALAEVGYDLGYLDGQARRAMEIAERKPVTPIDGSDMIYLPVRLGLMRPNLFDLVIIDEAQDMTVSQLEIATGICRKGRVVVIGDENQAIYGFRGADSQSMTRLRKELNADSLPLTTTYRCGKSIVREAQRFVPEYEAGPDNAEGLVLTDSPSRMLETARPGDFILSRTNAPLMKVALSLIRSGKRTQIIGRNIGEGLVKLVQKLKPSTIDDLIARVMRWEEREVQRLILAKRESRVEGIRDRASMLVELCEGMSSVDQLVRTLETMFADQNGGGFISCSSVHKAKGLEAHRVFMLTDTFRSQPQEERNINYVAITRAKSELTYVPEIS